MRTPIPKRDTFGRIYDRIIDRYPALAIKVWPGLGEFTVVSWNRYEVALRDSSGQSLVLKNNYARILLKEVAVWDRWYGPGFGGKVVLDVGAGCGETAWWFFRRGARKVIAVEADQSLKAYLERNSQSNGWNLEICMERFAPQHLGLGYDFVKIDCDGGETVLLDRAVSSLKPCRIELHPQITGRKIASSIVSKFGLKSIDGSDLWGSFPAEKQQLSTTDQ